MTVNELKEGMSAVLHMMVVSFTEKYTTSNKPYVQAELTDGKDQVSVKFWDLTGEYFEQKFPKGSVIEVSLTAKRYLDSLSYTAGKNLRTLDSSEYQINDFIKLPPVSPEKLYENVLAIFRKADEKHKETAALITYLYQKYETELKTWSGAKSVHHNLRGGLLWHMYRMALMGLKLPVNHLNIKLDTYEKALLQSKDSQSPDFKPSAKYIGEHTIRPVKEDEVKELLAILDWENPYLSLAEEYLGKTVIRELLKDRQILQTLKSCLTVTEIYPILDAKLMQAALLMIRSACNQGQRTERGGFYTNSILTGEAYIASLPLANKKTEEVRLLRKVILSADCGQSGITGTDSLPEVCILSELWAISAYSYADNLVLAAGCLIHDIGKLIELDTDSMGIADYSLDGNLFGHMVLGLDLLEEAIQSTEISKSVADLYRHIIASHHGKKEWGALCAPAFPEAAIVHHLDMIDSRIFQYEEALEKLEAGQLSEKIFSLGTRIYRSVK